MIVSCPSCQRNYVVADEQIAGKQFRARCKSCGVEFRLNGMGAGEATGASPNEPAKFMSATEAYLALQSTPPPNPGNWSVCLSQTDTRRMSTDEIVQAVVKGTIKTAVFVWRSSMGNWLRLNEVPELVAAITKAGGRVPHARATAEPKLPAGTGASPSVVPAKPVPPARHQTLGSQTPPPPTPSVLPARSGQTMPPPSLAEAPAAAPTRAAEAPAESKQPTNAAAHANAAVTIEPAPGANVSAKPDAANAAAAVNANAPAVNAVNVDAPVAAAVNANAPVANAVNANAPVAAAGLPNNAPVPQASTASVAPANGAVRRNTPAPPQRRATLIGFPEEIEVPIPPEPALPSPGSGVMLPPLQGGEAAAAATATAAAAALAVATSHQSPAPTAPVTEKRDSEGERKPSPSAESVAATTTSKPAASSLLDSTPPGKPAKTKSVAGVVVAMGAIGLVGVLGGVAGAIYVMKSAMGVQPMVASANIVAMQPQAAMPSPTPSVKEESPPAVASVAAATPPSAVEEPAASAAVAVESEAPAHAAAKVKSAGHAVAAVPAAPHAVAASTPTPTPKVSGKGAESKLPAGNALPSLPPADKMAKETSAAPPSNAGPFNRDAAMVVLSLAASRAASCKKPDGPTGTAKVHVTFDPSGAVVIANVVGSPIAGTPVAQCVAGLFRRIKVPPFSGERASLSRDVTIPP